MEWSYENPEVPFMELNSFHMDLSETNETQRYLDSLYHGTTTLAFKYNNGIIVAADSRASGGSFIYSESVEKVFPINRHILGTMAGRAADCEQLSAMLIDNCKTYEKGSDKRMSVTAAAEYLVKLSTEMQDVRAGIILSGYEPNNEPAIYAVSPVGVKKILKMIVVGSGGAYALGCLDMGHRMDMSDEEAYELAERSIYHASFRDTFTGGIAHIFHIKNEGWRQIERTDILNFHYKFGLYDNGNMDQEAAVESTDIGTIVAEESAGDKKQSSSSNSKSAIGLVKEEESGEKRDGGSEKCKEKESIGGGLNKNVEDSSSSHSEVQIPLKQARSSQAIIEETTDDATSHSEDNKEKELSESAVSSSARAFNDMEETTGDASEPKVGTPLKHMQENIGDSNVSILNVGEGDAATIKQTSELKVAENPLKQRRILKARMSSQSSSSDQNNIASSLTVEQKRGLKRKRSFDEKISPSKMLKIMEDTSQAISRIIVESEEANQEKST